MEQKLEVSSKLDLAVNKDDLMEMLIDQQLTKIEEEVEKIKEENKELQLKVTEIIDSDKKKKDAQLMKLLPKEIVTDEIPILDYNNTSWSNKTVTFTFKSFSVEITKVDTSIKTNPNVTAYQDKIGKNSNKINELNTNITKIEKSGKRIKARMLKEFLNNSEEGKSILKLMNTQQVKLLG